MFSLLFDNLSVFCSLFSIWRGGGSWVPLSNTGNGNITLWCLNWRLSRRYYLEKQHFFSFISWREGELGPPRGDKIYCRYQYNISLLMTFPLQFPKKQKALPKDFLPWRNILNVNHEIQNYINRILSRIMRNIKPWRILR